MSESKKSVLFVCLGNICRSPMAEAVFVDLLKQRGLEDKWTVDSAAVIGYHTGKQPEKRTLATLEKLGVHGYRHKARVVTVKDFRTFDVIFGMDDSNISDLEDLERKAGASSKASVEMLGSYDPQGHRIVPDPYYESGVALFEQVFHQCVRCCTAFLDKNM